MILAISLVVVWCTSHLALNHDHEFVANLELFRYAGKVIDPGQELRDEFHLIGVVIGMAVELSDRKVR